MNPDLCEDIFPPPLQPADPIIFIYFSVCKASFGLGEKQVRDFGGMRKGGVSSGA